MTSFPDTYVSGKCIEGVIIWWQDNGKTMEKVEQYPRLSDATFSCLRNIMGRKWSDVHVSTIILYQLRKTSIVWENNGRITAGQP